jgi:hypothetical protein
MKSDNVKQLPPCWNISEVREHLHRFLAPVLESAMMGDSTVHLETLRWLSYFLPFALRPTTLQLTTRHHAYIDLIPSPLLRDHLIKAGDDTVIKFLTELGPVTYETKEQGPLTIWGSDYLHESGWEFSSEFLDRWKDLLTRDWSERANYWRHETDR